MQTDCAPFPQNSGSSTFNTESWYLVHTKPRQEDVALANLERQNYACYMPRMRIERIRRRKARAGRTSTVDVSQLVHFGTRATKVDDTLVSVLHQQEQAMPTKAMFHIGDTAIIADGPFALINAIYQTADAERRA